MFVCVLGMLRIGERRLVMNTMMQMEDRLAKGDDAALQTKVIDLGLVFPQQINLPLI